MILDIKQLFTSEGATLPVAAEVDLSQVRWHGAKILPTPVHLKGMVENRAGVVTLTYEITYRLETVCDRCLAPIARASFGQFTHGIVEKLYGDDNALLLICEDGRLDLTELVTADILLELPIKQLCREDCKGLCPKCGTNLNESSCGCDTRQVDPRLDALRKLLEENDD